jgi:hypothetical protein
MSVPATLPPRRCRNSLILLVIWKRSLRQVPRSIILTSFGVARAAAAACHGSVSPHLRREDIPRPHHEGLLPLVISVITITGIGDHLQPERLITFTEIRKDKRQFAGSRARARTRHIRRLLRWVPYL